MPENHLNHLSSPLIFFKDIFRNTIYINTYSIEPFFKAFKQGFLTLVEDATTTY